MSSAQARMSIDKVTEKVNEIDLPPTTKDAFFRGQFHLLQPKSGGHRSGIDALLLAATLSDQTNGHLADFGSGAGAAGLAAATRCNGLTVDLVEVDPIMCRLAQESLKLGGNGHLDGRVNVLEADISLSGERRKFAGLQDETYDHVIMNPPFYEPANQRSPDPMRALAHMIGSGGLDPWLRSAAAVLKPGGRVAIINRPETLGKIIAGFQGRFGAAQILPVHSRAEEPASKIIVTGKKGLKAPLTMLPPLIIHGTDGAYTDEANAVFEGEGDISGRFD
ncbi:MAG: methyltransferase [Pseudomonadota bacterium]